MWEENVEIVRQVLERAQEGVRRDDHRTAFDQGVTAGIVDANLLWRAGMREGTGVMGFGDFVGRDGYDAMMRIWTEDFDDFEMEPEKVIAADANRVVVVVNQRGTGKGSGAPVEIRVAMVATLEMRRVVQIDVFLRPAEALEAAGLSE